MIIGNLHVCRVAILLDKANPTLIVYANAVRPGSVASQFFQPICGSYSQIDDAPRIIDHAQLSQSNLLNIGRKFPRPFPNVYFICFVVFK